MGVVFKNERVKEEITNLSDLITDDLECDYSESVVSTVFGDTNVLSTQIDEGKEFLLLLHGGSGNAAITVWLFEELVSKYNLIIPDIIGGCGKSEDKFLDPATDEYGEWLGDLLGRLDISSINIMAISQGAFSALRYLELGGERINKIILYVPASFVQPRLLSTMFKFLFPLLLLRITKWDCFYFYIEKHIFSSAPNSLISKYFMHAFKYLSIDLRQPKMIMSVCPNKNVRAFVISAENDLFFRGKKMQERALKYFGQSVETLFLDNCNHSLTKSHREFKHLLARISEFLDEPKNN